MVVVVCSRSINIVMVVVLVELIIVVAVRNSVIVIVVAKQIVFTIVDRAAHGLMPVPPPATLYLMQNMVLTAG